MRPAPRYKGSSNALPKSYFAQTDTPITEKQEGDQDHIFSQ